MEFYKNKKSEAKLNIKPFSSQSIRPSNSTNNIKIESRPLLTSHQYNNQYANKENKENKENHHSHTKSKGDISINSLYHNQHNRSSSRDH